MRIKYLFKFSFILFFGFYISSVSAEIKVAVVDIQYLIDHSPYTSKATQVLQQEFKSRESKIKENIKLLKKMKTDFNSNNTKLSNVQLRTRKRRIATLDRDIKRSESDFKELLNLRKNEEMLKVQKIIVDSINEVGKRDNYDIIFYNSITYFNKRVSISDIVLDMVKEKFKNEQQRKSP